LTKPKLESSLALSMDSEGWYEEGQIFGDKRVKDKTGPGGDTGHASNGEQIFGTDPVIAPNHASSNAEVDIVTAVAKGQGAKRQGKAKVGVDPRTSPKQTAKCEVHVFTQRN